MSDTFTMGINSDIYSSLMIAVHGALHEFAQSLAQLCGADASNLSGVAELIEETRKNIGEHILQKARKEHALPLRRVLGALPVDEMAELAETLINLQSLKEKVTKPSESVGGPVDVAAITRGEGLVWIKRKHYFDPELNPRFLHRQGMLYK